jgi:hypothetical protein
MVAQSAEPVNHEYSSLVRKKKTVKNSGLGRLTTQPTILVNALRTCVADPDLVGSGRLGPDPNPGLNK